MLYNCLASQDIFRMNQKQLEGAVRRMAGDKTLEPARKAYLMQHIMASRYIVAQQQHKLGVSSEGADTAQQPGDFHCTHRDRWDHCCRLPQTHTNGIGRLPHCPWDMLRTS
jgi:hypothetical protein